MKLFNKLFSKTKSKGSNMWITPRLDFLKDLNKEGFEYIISKGCSSIIDWLATDGPLIFNEMFNREMREFDLALVTFWKNPRDKTALEEINKRYNLPGNEQLLKEIESLSNKRKRSSKELENNIIHTYIKEMGSEPKEEDFKDVSESRMNKLIKIIENKVKDRLRENIRILLGENRDIIDRNPKMSFPIIKKVGVKYFLVDEYKKIYIKGVKWY